MGAVVVAAVMMVAPSMLCRDGMVVEEEDEKELRQR